MSGEGAPSLSGDGTGLTIEIVAAQWHAEITDALIAGATAACESAGATYRLTRVPGTVELTVVAERLARNAPDGIVALGLVVQGETPHFDYVCSSVTQGLTDVARTHGLPVGFGVLTTDNLDQARARAGLPGSKEDKGRETAEAVIATANVLKGIPWAP